MLKKLVGLFKATPVGVVKPSIPALAPAPATPKVEVKRKPAVKKAVVKKPAVKTTKRK